MTREEIQNAITAIKDFIKDAEDYLSSGNEKSATFSITYIANFLEGALRR